jgi:hypothetical protein
MKNIKNLILWINNMEVIMIAQIFIAALFFGESMRSKYSVREKIIIYIIGLLII